MTKTYTLRDTEQTRRMGVALSAVLLPPCIVFLEGSLGAGKTTLAQGVLAGLGITQSVKSPTYTIVETYDCTRGSVYHFDWYRLNDPQELEDIGIRDYLGQSAIVLIEWPQKASMYWGIQPDVVCELLWQHSGRRLIISAGSKKGAECLAQLKDGGER